MVYACLVSSPLNATIMIRKNSPFCKLIRIKTSSKFIFDSYMAVFQPELETCPVCGSCGNCHVHAYYDRSVIDFRNGRKVTDSLCVLRLICDSCHHTHALLSRHTDSVCLLFPDVHPPRTGGMFSWPFYNGAPLRQIFHHTSSAS